MEREFPQSLPNWQPTCLKLPFFIGAVTLTLLHSALCAILLVFNYTGSTMFSFDASNVPAFFFWQFIPITLAVVSGVVWEVIYIEVCRLQPYRDLASPQGSNLKKSLSQTYLTSFSWFVPYHALKHTKKHSGLAAISMTYLLSYGVLPTVSVAMIKIQWNESITEGTAQPLMYFIVLALFVSLSTVAFAVAGFVILQRQKSGLHSSPGSLAGLGALVAESNLLQKFQSLSSLETQEGIDRALGDLQLGLESTGTAYQISVVDPSQTLPDPRRQPWRRDTFEAHPWWLRGWTYIGLNVIIFVPYIVFYNVLTQQAEAALLYGNPLEINGGAFAIKVTTAIMTLLNAAIYANWHLNVAILQPFYKLTRHVKSYRDGKIVERKLPGSSSALRMDFTGSAISNLIRPGQSFDVWLMAICALLTQLSVITRPAVFQNLAFIVGLTLDNSSNPVVSGLFDNMNIPAGVVPLRIICYVFEGIYAFFGVVAIFFILIKWRKPFLPRKPHTLSSQILYLCHATELLEDLKGMSNLSKKARDTHVKKNGHKYALGWREDESKTSSYVGVDRLESISRRFEYPKQDAAGIARRNVTQQAYERVHPGGLDEYKARRDAGWPENAR